MVAPLALIAVVWDARRERATRALTDRTITLGQRALSLGTVITGG
jgi:hypothetical protein